MFGLKLFIVGSGSGRDVCRSFHLTIAKFQIDNELYLIIMKSNALRQGKIMFGNQMFGSTFFRKLDNS